MLDGVAVHTHGWRVRIETLLHGLLQPSVVSLGPV
jgi:hypothetical protein